VQHRILVVEDDPNFLQLIKTLLIKNGYIVGEAEHGALAMDMVETFKPDLIISDVMMPGVDGFQLCQLLRVNRDTNHIPIIMLTALSALEQKIKGFESGADDYLVKPFESQELLARVSAAIRRAEQLHIESASHSRKGKVTAVFSLRGGAGVSSIAVNLASAQAQLWQEETILVDMDWVGGQSALFMNAPLRSTWANLAKSPVREIDEAMLEQVLVHHESGVKILAAPQRPEQAKHISSEMVSQVIQILKGKYEYLVLDMPHHFNEPNLAAMDRADTVLLVSTQEIAGIRSAMTAFRLFDGLGFDPAKIKFVVNTHHEVVSITPDMIEKTLRRTIDFHIPYAPKEVVPSLNAGKPVVLSKPTSTFGVALEDIAFVISKPEHNLHTIDKPNKALARVYERINRD
jgi:pilus assembly protein CpaE